MKTIKLILFYLASFTWGAIMSIIGLIAGLALTITGHLPKVFHGRLYWEVGKDWGGVELGCFFICSKGSGDQLKQHEAGHGLQNIILGPFFPIIIGIPSALRYWFREMKELKDKYMFGIITWVVIALLGVGVSCFAILAPHEFFQGVRAFHASIDALGTFLILYGAILGSWLMFIEAPKYAKNEYVPYDNFWPEAWATRWGAKYFA